MAQVLNSSDLIDIKTKIVLPFCLRDWYFKIDVKGTYLNMSAVWFSAETILMMTFYTILTEISRWADRDSLQSEN